MPVLLLTDLRVAPVFYLVMVCVPASVFASPQHVHSIAGP